MTPDAIIVLIVIFISIILFATEIIAIDLTAIFIMMALVITGVITPEEGVAGFSNSATLTVAFMFVISSALYKTGVLQLLAPRLANAFRRNFTYGMIVMMFVVAFVSSFINNTPVVAVFIPVIIQLANSIGKSPSKMLIPLSFAAIFGGTCTLIGTSTNILISGIVEMQGLESFSMFIVTPMGLIFLVIGILYMIFIGIPLLPIRKTTTSLKENFGTWGYLTEIELLKGSEVIGKRIADSSVVREYNMTVLEVRRENTKIVSPSDNLILNEKDVLKVKCSADNLNNLKDRVRIRVRSPIKMADDKFSARNTTLIELVITVNSEFNGLTLQKADFRRKYRATPLAIRTRDEVLHENLHEVELCSGDVLLAEVKTHFLSNLKEIENEPGSPFIIISEETKHEFNLKRTIIVSSVLFLIVLGVTLNLISIMIATISGVSILVLLRCIKMKEVYESINWNVIFLLAGSLSLGVAMQKSGLAELIADALIGALGRWGPTAIISGLYLTTSILTSVMSNNASAALLAPIAIATAINLDLSPIPFLMAITFAASASFMTPVGYQTNTMIYNAGQYKFKDFLLVGTLLNIIFWLIASFFIPLIYEF